MGASFIESDLNDNIESCYSSLSQFCYCYKVVFTKHTFVVDTNYYINIESDLYKQTTKNINNVSWNSRNECAHKQN